MSQRGGGATLPIAAAMRVQNVANPGDIVDTCKHILRIAAFIVLTYVVYSPFGGWWIQIPAAPVTRESWAAANHTAAAWDTPGWDWDSTCSPASHAHSAPPS